MKILSYARILAMILIAFCAVVPASPAWAGTTGSLSGNVTDSASGAPIAGAKVVVVSPGQSATGVTDAGGNFFFLTLQPDTYTLSVEAKGYDSIVTSGVTIFADQVQRLTLKTDKSLKTIGTVKSRSAADLVRSGAVTDSYSVNASTQARVTGLGGGGALNQAFSALAATPGVSVPAGQSGWSQMAGVTIRGGTHSQIGYELDGIPVNVGINFFPGTNLSTLGQQEVQVYSGSAPLNSESQGLSGFINQVIKTGTYPGFASVDAGLGSPAFYHKLSAEGAFLTTDRRLSVYVGLLGADQTFRYVDNANAASYTSNYGLAYNTIPCPSGAGLSVQQNYAACYSAFTPGGLGTGPGGFVFAPVNYLQAAYQQDRENVANIHYYFPHKDGSRDDVQFLAQTGGIVQYFYSSADDLGVPAYDYPVGNVYTGAVGTFLPSNWQSLVKPYYFPPGNQQGIIPANLRDSQRNDQGVFKAQWTHSLGQAAYLKLYGYTLYSDFMFDAPNGASSPASGFLANPPDYKLWTHTSGYVSEFADQLSSRNLFSANASFTHAPSVRDFSLTSFTGPGSTFAVAVDSTNPNSGLCYAAPVSGSVATPSSCFGGAPAAVTFGAANGSGPAPPSLNGLTCNGHPCSYYVVENGQQGLLNEVTQDTLAFALSDQWKPNDKLTFEYGIRFHDYMIKGVDTNTGTRPFWFNAYNQDYCVNALPGNTPIAKSNLPTPIAVTASCASADGNGVNYVAVHLNNAPADYTFPRWEPRLGATYSLDQNTVLRVSSGEYTQPPPSGYQQYNVIQQDLPGYIAGKFYKYGYTGSGHDIAPQQSYNTDASLEHAFRGSDVSFKLTPFYRQTNNELTEFFINPAAQVTSGLPVGTLTSQGLEFQLRKGSFDRDGISAILSYTYTDARIKYSTLPGGGSVLSPINNDIKIYNGYTSYCFNHPKDARCGPTNATGGSTAPCFTQAGQPDPSCGPGSFANPYWNAPVQSLLDPNGSYWPTDPVVATTSLGVNGYTPPHVATVVLNYRKHAFAITPSLQIQAGQRYGAPEANAGIDPAGGCGILASSVAGDPRYPYGAPGGSPYNAVSCLSALNAIPDVFTGKFDAIGAFTSPTQLLGSITMSYDISKRVGFTLTAANVINQCFGGSQAAWTGSGGPHVCSYINGEISRGYAPTGNVYNPGSTFDNFGRLPYYPYLGPYTMGVVAPSGPFSLFGSLNIKL